jgi:hypothetical protein
MLNTWPKAANLSLALFACERGSALVRPGTRLRREEPQRSEPLACNNRRWFVLVALFTVISGRFVKLRLPYLASF